jgi:4'-phosphopantetheinyl transferase EntD
MGAGVIEALPAIVRVGAARVMLHAAAQPATLEDLTPNERAQALRLRERRQDDYLLGRAALKKALAALGLGDDTSAIRMPHPSLSLTHGGGIAIAAGGAGEDVIGIGVDWEPDRPIDPRASKFFLSACEMAAIEPDAERLIRLWTVKEALYKATPENANLTVRMFETIDPNADRGQARLERAPDVLFAYESRRLAHGFLSVAIALRAGDPALTSARIRE